MLYFINVLLFYKSVIQKKYNFFISTMMALFLPVIVSKKNKQTEKNMSFIAVYHKFTQILKKTRKTPS